MDIFLPLSPLCPLSVWKWSPLTVRVSFHPHKLRGIQSLLRIETHVRNSDLGKKDVFRGFLFDDFKTRKHIVKALRGFVVKEALLYGWISLS